MSPNRPAAIFDGDDTLWKTQPLYRAVEDEFCRRLEMIGFEGETIRSLFASINRRLLRTMKMSRERFPQAMVETYLTLCQDAHTKPNEKVSADLTILAQEVFTGTPELIEHAHQVLSTLSKDCSLIFYSGGDREVQQTRLDRLSLAHHFEDRTYIVLDKSDSALKQILEEQGLRPEETWMIGNSPRFDINPALRLGLNCIWMHTDSWEEDIEEFECDKIFVAFSLDQAANILVYGSGFGEQAYIAPGKRQEELKRKVEERGLCLEDAWLVGNSPRADINPALGLGLECIWMPTSFEEDDIEPFVGKTFVALSLEGASRILGQHGQSDIKKVLWYIRDASGTQGRSFIVD